VLRLEEVRRKREERCDRYVWPLDQKRNLLAEGEESTLGFRPLPPPTDEEVGVVLAAIDTRVRRLLRRRGFDVSLSEG